MTLFQIRKYLNFQIPIFYWITLKHFLKKKKLSINWKELEKQNICQVINTLSMISPFSLEEKQILLEANNLESRKKILLEILNIYLSSYVENKTMQ